MSRKNKRMGNTHTDAFLANLPKISLEAPDCVLTQRCKFNFYYFNFTPPAASFDCCGVDLLKHLKVFSEHPLEYWEKKKHAGSCNTTYLVYYDNYPPAHKTKFAYPRNVPSEARWCRLILSGKQRLIGFTVPEKLHDTHHPTTGVRFDKNTFYCVFVDRRHEFWIM